MKVLDPYYPTSQKLCVLFIAALCLTVGYTKTAISVIAVMTVIFITFAAVIRTAIDMVIAVLILLMYRTV